MEELLLRSLCAGLLLASMTGPLGCFVVWQRMAYFGDTLSHAGLLGIALSLLLAAPINIGVLVFAIVLALILGWLYSNSKIPLDTLLGILTHTSLALGIVVLGLADKGQVDWLGYLFGDLLSISWLDIAWMATVAAIVLTILLSHWRKFVLLALDKELAQVDGLRVTLLQNTLLVLIAATVASAIQIVGVLLVTALLIIPAATARNVSSSPTQMAIRAVLIGMAATGMGIVFSYYVDVSTGPAIVLAAFMLFSTSLFIGRRT